MGNVDSNQSETGPICKRARLGVTSTNTNDDPNHDSRHFSQTPLNCTNKRMWEALPYVALLEIYKHLSNNDRSSMCRTCKAWSLPFSRPALWRRGNFHFNGMEDWRAMQFVALMGTAIRHIVADCSAPEEALPDRAKSSAANLCTFLSSLLIANNTDLYTLCICNLSRLFHHWNRPIENLNPLGLMTSLLTKQTQLRTLDLTNAGFQATQGIRLLENLRCPVSIKDLRIIDTVSVMERFDLIQNRRFVKLIESFTCLTELHLNEDYISNCLLMSLCATVSSTLVHMAVKAHYNLRRRPREELEQSWGYFCDHMIHTQLSFYVKGVFAGRLMVKILPACLSLCRLHWDAGNSLFDLKSFCRHLVNYKKYLRFLYISIFIFTNDDAEHLFLVVRSLPNLESLHIDSPLTPLPILNILKNSIHRCLASRSPEDKVLKDVVINGQKMDLKEGWYSYLTRWLTEHII